MIFLSLSIVTGSISRGDECTLGSTDQDEITGPCSSAEGRVCCQKPDTDKEKEDFQTEVINFIPFSLFFVACLLCSILNANCICICDFNTSTSHFIGFRLRPHYAEKI